MTERDDKIKRIGELVSTPMRPPTEEERIKGIERIIGEEIGDLAGIDLPGRREALWSRVCPSRFLDAEMADLIPIVRDRVEEWGSAKRGRNLVIAGSVGTGKTHAAIVAAHERHRRGLSVAFWPVAELYQALRPGGEEGILDDVIDVDVLVLDDLGLEKVSDWTHEQLGIIVNRRWLDQRPTIATTNLVGKALREAISDRVYDRLVDDDAVKIVLEGGSRRRGVPRG